MARKAIQNHALHAAVACMACTGLLITWGLLCSPPRVRRRALQDLQATDRPGRRLCHREAQRRPLRRARPASTPAPRARRPPQGANGGRPRGG